jgi:hypothetical protein
MVGHHEIHSGQHQYDADRLSGGDGFMQKNEAEIRKVVLADDVKYVAKDEIPADAFMKDWNLNGEQVWLAVKR